MSMTSSGLTGPTTDLETTTRKYWDKTWARILRHKGMIAPSGKLVQLLIPHVARGEPILDLGCGEGRNTIYLGRIGYRAVGLDLSFKGVSVLQNNLFEEEVKAWAMAGDARQLPFASGSFAGVLAHNLFDHLDADGLQKAFAEVFRILRPRGSLLLTIDPLPPTLKDKEIVAKDDGSRIHVAGSNKGLLMRPVTDAEFKRLVEHGWTILKDELSPRQSRIVLLRKTAPDA